MKNIFHIDGFVQDCSNSGALAMELLQSCTKPSIYKTIIFSVHIPLYAELFWWNIAIYLHIFLWKWVHATDIC